MADRDIFEEMVRAGAVAMWGSTERDATKIARMVLSAALAERQVVDLPDAETIARHFHDTYERLAPQFNYQTREASSKPWDDVPQDNKALMVAVAQHVREWIAAGSGSGEGAQRPDTSDDDLFTDLDAW